MLTIGKLAKASGVGVETVRFYERKGLIQKPKKKQGQSFNTYKNDDAVRIRFIKRAQDLGFTLREIKSLLDLNLSPKASCEAVRERAEEKLKEIESKIADLNRMKASLKSLKKAAARGVTDSSCRQITDCFEGECC